MPPKAAGREPRGLQSPAQVAITAPETQFSFKDAFPFPGVIVIMGHRGRGKTATAYWVMDQWHKVSKGKLGGVILNYPQSLKNHLPEWVTITQSITRVSQNAVVVLDEAQFLAHARRSASASNLEMASLVSLSRQRNQLIILIAHHSRKLDVMDVMEASRVVWKEPTEGHLMFERKEMKHFTARALRAFGALADSNGRDPRGYAYVMDFERLRFGMVRTGLPAWWNEQMSHGMSNLK